MGVFYLSGLMQLINLQVGGAGRHPGLRAHAWTNWVDQMCLWIKLSWNISFVTQTNHDMEYIHEEYIYAKYILSTLTTSLR